MQRIAPAAVSALVLAVIGSLPPAAAAASSAGLSAGRAFLARPTGSVSASPFVINDRGVLLTAYGASRAGRPVVVVAQVSRSNKLVHSQVVGLPANAIEAGSLSLALTDDGQVALALWYYTGAAERVGYSTWRFGKRPPLVQALSPPGPNDVVTEGPKVVVDHRGQTFAAWIYKINEVEMGQVQVAQAEGNRHTVKTLDDGDEGEAGALSLELTGAGRPMVDWASEDGSHFQRALLVAATRAPGGVWGAAQTATFPEQFAFLRSEATFSTDSAGNQIFSSGGGRSSLSVAFRVAGRAFGRRRLIAKHVASGSVVAAGGKGTVLMAWTTHDHLIAEVGKLDGRMGAPQKLGPSGPFSVAAAVDNEGRAILVWDAMHHGRTNDGQPYGIWVATAGVSGRFGRPVFISNRSETCTLAREYPFEEPLVESPNGRALIFWRCGDLEPQITYVARYTP